MEIKRVTEENFREFVECAGGMAYNVLLPMIYKQEMRQALCSYIKEEHLHELMVTNQASLWIAWEGNQVLGVSAMENNGHITVWDVYPYYQRKGIGFALLSQMKDYARESLGLSEVTANAMPVASRICFEHCGFKVCKEQVSPMDFISLVDSTSSRRSYRRRPVATWVIVTAILGLVLVTTGIVGLFITLL